MKADIEIERPAGEVFDYIANFENNPEWQDGMQTAAYITDPPHGKGSEYEQTAKFMGRSVETRFEITDFQPGKSVTIESRESTFPIKVTRTVEPLGPSRTRVRAEISGGPGGLMRIFAPLAGRLAQHSINADYQRLKEKLESGSS